MVLRHLHITQVVAVGLLITLAPQVLVETGEVETQGHFQMEMVPMDRQIQAAAAEVVLLLQAHPVVQAAQSLLQAVRVALQIRPVPMLAVLARASPSRLVRVVRRVLEQVTAVQAVTLT